MQKAYLSIAEAAAEVGITPRSVRNRIWRGAFPHVRLGGRVLIPAKELATFLAGLRGVNAQGALARETEDWR